MSMYLLRMLASLFIYFGFLCSGAMLGIVAKADFLFWVLLAVSSFGLALTARLALRGLKKQELKTKKEE